MKRRWYATPYALWMLIFTIVPLLFVVYFAFTTSRAITSRATRASRVFFMGPSSCFVRSLPVWSVGL